MSFLFVAASHLGETRTLPSIFLPAKRDIQWDRSRSEQTGQRPVESLLLRQKVSRIFLGTFSFCLQLPTRERRERYRPSFCAHFPAFQIKAENLGTGVPGKQKLADEYSKRKSGRSHKDLPLYWRHHPDLNWGIKALQASALPLGYGAGKRMGTM